MPTPGALTWLDGLIVGPTGATGPAGSISAGSISAADLDNNGAAYATAAALRGVVDTLSVGRRCFTLDALSSGDAGGAYGDSAGYWRVRTLADLDNGTPGSWTDNVGTRIRGSVNGAERVWSDPGTVKARWFGASASASAAVNSTALQAAIDTATGITVKLPGGRITYDTSLDVPAAVNISGAGMGLEFVGLGTHLIYTGTGYGLKRALPINASNYANAKWSEFTIECTNDNNEDGGLVDVGGTHWQWEKIRVIEFKFGGILDQSEISTVRDCMFERQLDGGAGLWLVNGAEYTPGADGGYTNNIRIEDCYFNLDVDTYGIVDDGGYGRNYVDNSFNAGKIWMRLAGVAGLAVSGGYFEGVGDYGVNFTFQSLYGSVDVGQCAAVSWTGGILNAGSKHCFVMTSGPAAGFFAGITCASSVAAFSIGSAYSLHVDLTCRNASTGGLVTGVPRTGKIPTNTGQWQFSDEPLLPQTVSSTSYDILANSAPLLVFTGTDPEAFVRPDSSQFFVVGARKKLLVTGSTDLTVTGSTGVTLNGTLEGSFTVPAGSGAELRKLSANSWFLTLHPAPLSA